MPDQDSVAGNARLLRGLIWAGVLLAPVAAAVVLLGQSSNTVRFAVLLIAVALVLIGSSVLVRNDPVLGQMAVEERVAEEVATLRRELRAEFGGGRGAAQVHGGPPRGGRPPPMPAAAAVATVRRQPPEEEPSGFFADFPVEGQYPDPFAGDYPENNYSESEYADEGYAVDGYQQDDYPGDGYGPQPVSPMPPDPSSMPPGPSVMPAPPLMPPGPPPMGSARPPAPAGGRAGVPAPAGGRADLAAPAGGRAGIPAPAPAGSRAGVPAPVASAAVRPPARTGPGMTTGGRQIKPEPGTSSGGRAVAAAAAAVPPPPQLPRQRGAASMPPQTPPRASAAVRPGNPYGPDSLAEDFGAGSGYAAQAPGVYGSPASTNTYGAPAGTYGGGGDDFDSDEYNGYGAPSYGADYAASSADYGPVAAADYGPAPHEPGTTTGDPNYKARRHRPSANDTNVGSLSDFASYGGYLPDPGHGRR